MCHFLLSALVSWGLPQARMHFSVHCGAHAISHRHFGALSTAGCGSIPALLGKDTEQFLPFWGSQQSVGQLPLFWGSLWVSHNHFGEAHKLICLSGAGHAVSLCHFGVDKRLTVAQSGGAMPALSTESLACSPLPHFPSGFFEPVSHSSACLHHPMALSSDQDLSAGAFFFCDTDPNLADGGEKREEKEGKRKEYCPTVNNHYSCNQKCKSC